MIVSLRFLECGIHTPRLDDYFYIEYEDGIITVRCRKCGVLLYSKILKG